jgi:hypothetical protein
VTTRTGNLALGLVALLAAPLAVATGAASHTSEQSKTATQIVADAKAAMLGAENFHVRGVINDAGTATSLNLSMSPDGGGGSVQLPGVTMEIVVAAHEVYIKADEKSWLKLTGSKPTAELVADRWIEASASNADFSSFADLTDSKTFMAQLTTGWAKFSKLQATPSWGGHKSIVLTDNQGDRLYVVDGATPYMLHLQGQGGGSSGYMTFSDFGSAPMPKVPANAISFPTS